jgi:hypothetical protein
LGVNSVRLSVYRIPRRRRMEMEADVSGPN